MATLRIGHVEMSILTGIGIYLAALLVLVGEVSLLPNSNGSPTIILYLVFGLVMNRIVLRGLISYHPNYDTLENVSSHKLKYFLFWPFAYPFLFLRLCVERIL